MDGGLLAARNCRHRGKDHRPFRTLDDRESDGRTLHDSDVDFIMD